MGPEHPVWGLFVGCPAGSHNAGQQVRKCFAKWLLPLLLVGLLRTFFFYPEMALTQEKNLDMIRAWQTAGPTAQPAFFPDNTETVLTQSRDANLWQLPENPPKGIEHSTVHTRKSARRRVASGCSFYIRESRTRMSKGFKKFKKHYWPWMKNKFVLTGFGFWCG